MCSSGWFGPKQISGMLASGLRRRSSEIRSSCGTLATKGALQNKCRGHRAARVVEQRLDLEKHHAFEARTDHDIGQSSAPIFRSCCDKNKGGRHA